MMDLFGRRWLPLMLFTCYLSWPHRAVAQGPPDIIWMRPASGTFAAVTPDGLTIVTADNVGLVKVWDAASGALVRTIPTRHTTWVRGMALSADGQTVLTGSDDHTARLFRVSDGLLLREVDHGATVQCVSISPDGATIASGGAYPDYAAKLWRVSDGALLQTMTGHTYTLRSLAFSPDGQMLASGAQDNTTRLWQVSDGKLANTLANGGTVYAVAFSPDSQALATAADSRPVKIWRASDGALQKDLTGHTYGGSCLRYSSDGLRLVSGGWEGAIKIWNTSDWTLNKNIDTGVGDVRTVSPSADGQYIIAGQIPGGMIWRMADGGLVRKLTTGCYSSTRTAFSPDGLLMATASGGTDCGARIWRVSDGEQLVRIQHDANLWFAVFSPDGQTLLTGDQMSRIRLWSVPGGTYKGEFNAGHDGYVASVAFSPDGTQMVSVGDGGEANLWRTSDWAFLRTFGPIGGGADSVAFSPDGLTVAVGYNDSHTRIWRVSDGALLRDLSGHSGQVWGVAFSPDGQMLAANAELWRVSDGALLNTLANAMPPIVFSPDGHTLLTGGVGGKLLFWNVAGGTLESYYDEETWPEVTGLAISPLDQSLGIARSDGTVLLARYPASAVATALAVGGVSGTFGDTVTLVATLTRTDTSAPIEGRTIDFSVDGTSAGSATTNASGVATCAYLIPESLGAGTKAIGASFAGDSGYSASTGSGTLTVNKHAVSVLAADASGCVGQTVTLSATLTLTVSGAPIASASIDFRIDGTSVGSGATNASGIATLSHKIAEGAGAGSRTISAVFAGDALHDGASGTATLTVSASPTSTSTISRTGTITDNVILRGYLKRTIDNAWVTGRTVSFMIDGTTVGSGTTNADGRADLTWAIADGPATRTITAAFAGDSAYNASSGTATLTAQSWGTKMATFDRAARITGRTELKCRLLRSDNAPLYNKTISFSVDGAFVINRSTDTQGYAKYPYYDVPEGSGAGVRTILSAWVGDGGYAAVSRTATLTVQKALPYIWVLPKTVPHGATAGLYAYFRRLYDCAKQPGKEVTFRINCTAVQTLLTDANGVARYAYPTTEPVGDHTIRCEFAGDAWVDAGYGEGRLRIY